MQIANAFNRTINIDTRDEEKGEKRQDTGTEYVNLSIIGSCIDKLIVYHDMIVFVLLPILWYEFMIPYSPQNDVVFQDFILFVYCRP